MGRTYVAEREVAIRAVRQAVALCRAVRDEIQPEAVAKADLSPVTVADLGSQALICRALAQAFPDDAVIAEEDSSELRRPEDAAMLGSVLRYVRAIRPEADAASVRGWIDRGGSREYAVRFWTLDPIDGTKGFLRGGQYAIALALVVEGTIEVAALACPNLPLEPGAIGPPGAILVAGRGRGASVRPIDGDEPERSVRVSLLSDPAAARFCESVEASHSAHDEAAAVAARLGIAGSPARLDSQAKYAVVARGEAEIYLRLPTRPDYRERIWDHAAGVLIVEEAGGVVTDVAGRRLEFTHGRDLAANRGVIVTNGRLHDRVLAALEAPGTSSQGA
jgi:3'(2'), 5'-bisphosphate nucleotidase